MSTSRREAGMLEQRKGEDRTAQRQKRPEGSIEKMSKPIGKLCIHLFIIQMDRYEGKWVKRDLEKKNKK